MSQFRPLRDLIMMRQAPLDMISLSVWGLLIPLIENGGIRTPKVSLSILFLGLLLGDW